LTVPFWIERLVRHDGGIRASDLLAFVIGKVESTIWVAFAIPLRGLEVSTVNDREQHHRALLLRRLDRILRSINENRKDQVLHHPAIYIKLLKQSKDDARQNETVEVPG